MAGKKALIDIGDQIIDLISTAYVERDSAKYVKKAKIALCKFLMVTEKDLAKFAKEAEALTKKHGNLGTLELRDHINTVDQLDFLMSAQEYENFVNSLEKYFDFTEDERGKKILKSLPDTYDDLMRQHFQPQKFTAFFDNLRERVCNDEDPNGGATAPVKVGPKPSGPRSGAAWHKEFREWARDAMYVIGIIGAGIAAGGGNVHPTHPHHVPHDPAPLIERLHVLALLLFFKLGNSIDLPPHVLKKAKVLEGAGLQLA